MIRKRVSWCVTCNSARDTVKVLHIYIYIFNIYTYNTGIYVYIYYIYTIICFFVSKNFVKYSVKLIFT